MIVDKDVAMQEADENNIWIYCPHCGYKQTVPKTTDNWAAVQCDNCRRTVIAMAWSITPWRKSWWRKIKEWWHEFSTKAEA